MTELESGNKESFDPAGFLIYFFAVSSLCMVSSWKSGQIIVPSVSATFYDHHPAKVL